MLKEEQTFSRKRKTILLFVKKKSLQAVSDLKVYTHFKKKV
jgi:hypothetical protein